MSVRRRGRKGGVGQEVREKLSEVGMKPPSHSEKSKTIE